MLQSQIFDNHLVFTIAIYTGGCSILLHTWTMGFGFAMFNSSSIVSKISRFLYSPIVPYWIHLVACRNLRIVDRQYVFLHPFDENNPTRNWIRVQKLRARYRFAQEAHQLYQYLSGKTIIRSVVMVWILLKSNTTVHEKTLKRLILERMKQNLTNTWDKNRTWSIKKLWRDLKKRNLPTSARAGLILPEKRDVMFHCKPFEERSYQVDVNFWVTKWSTSWIVNSVQPCIKETLELTSVTSGLPSLS